MNDRHPSGYPAYDSHAQQHPAPGYGEYGDGDPLFGSLPGSHDTSPYGTGGYETGQYDAAPYDTGGYTYGTGTYDAGTYDAGAYETGSYQTTGTYAAPTTTYDHTGAYDTGSYATTGSYTADGYATGTYDSGSYDTGAYDTGTYGGYDPYAHTTDENAGSEQYRQHDQYPQYDQYEQPAYGTGTYDTGSYDTGQYATGAYDTAGHDATAIWSTADQNLIADIPAQAGPPAYETVAYEAAEYDASGYDTAEYNTAEYGTSDYGTAEYDAADVEPPRFEADSPTRLSDPTDDPTDDATSVADAMTQAMPVTAPAPAARRVAGPAAGKPVRGRGRRRTAKRSALLTVAVPSVAAMGVCAAAAASVTGFVGDDKKDDKPAQAMGDAGSVKASAANKKLDTQLAGLSADARDFGDRANRTQERIDLKQRQALEKKRAADEAARKEALRPKFVLPVTDHGLSALFGQAGVNWMSVHTGIDFPVSYGTPVMAATDGTVRTQWNSAYGNMAIVTAADGTETWYCHLSSTKIRSGSVKAGDQIAYSGNSGNSTGPHLHFEVRPGGDSAIDPLPWLRSHGLDPN
ncbi:M23 family metallopeptidase [Streptomyces sp. NPDC048483]|uniref:M23 family metallopeptidase n=1 Tax=Streptomyces sp. NPDC048483 TaxID=3154927 RepID=UPI003434C71D